MAMASASHLDATTTNWLSDHQINQTTSIGSSLKFALVASGQADVYPRFGPTMEWDTAAGQAICNAVGIEVMSKATNKPLLYNKENLLNPWFLVSKIGPEN